MVRAKSIVRGLWIRATRRAKNRRASVIRMRFGHILINVLHRQMFEILRTQDERNSAYIHRPVRHHLRVDRPSVLTRLKRLRSFIFHVRLA